MLRRHRRLCAALPALLAVLLLAAPAVAKETKKTTPEEVRAEVAKTLKTIGHYSAEQRDQAVAAAKEGLEKTDAAIDQVEERMDKDWDKMDAAARKNARETLRALQQQRNELAEWYGGLKHSSAGTWEAIKRGFSKSFKALGKTLEQAADKFKD